MKALKGSQRKYLRGLAHSLNPAAFVGQKGLTESLIGEVDQALEASELIKVKFVEFKKKEEKNELTSSICEAVQAHLAGMIGHVAILYRENKNPEKRTITLPK